MIRFFASHRTAANLLMIGILLLGAMSISSLERESFPDFTSSVVNINANYIGASAEDVEESVCQKIEEALEGINYVKEITATCREGSVNLEIEMEDKGDIQVFLDDIKQEIESITDFPDEVEDIVVAIGERVENILSVCITGPMSDISLYNYCDALKKDLLKISGVSQVTVSGFSKRQIRISVKEDVLRSYHISVDDLARQISNRSLNLPAGTMEGSTICYLLRFDDSRKTVQQFQDLIVISNSGAERRLGDIADITECFSDDDARSMYNGKRAGIVNVLKAKEDDALVVYDAVIKCIDEMRTKLPSGISLALTNDMASGIRDRINMITGNAMQGLFLVFLSMWLFFGFRFAFWIAMGLPVSFLGAFFLFPSFNVSVNMISTMAMLLATGILMDDAIVLSENIATHYAMGKKAIEAIVDGIKEVWMGVVYSFLTTMVIFVPLMFIKGMMGKVLRDLPIVLILILFVSFIEAFLILPRHLGHSLKSRKNREPEFIQKLTTAAMNWIRDNVIRRMIGFAIEWRYAAIGFTIFILVLAISMISGGVLKFDAFPNIQNTTIQCSILLPQGTPITTTEEVVSRVEKGAKAVAAKYDSCSKTGSLIESTSCIFGINSSLGESGPNTATYSIDLVDLDQRTVRNDELIAYWRQETGEIAGAIAVQFNEDTMGPAGLPLEIRISGTDLNELKLAADEIMNWLGQFNGVHDLVDDLMVGKPEITMNIKPGASTLGLSMQDISSQVRALFNGSKTRDVQVEDKTYEVKILLADHEVTSISELEQLPIKSLSGVTIPLKNLVDFRMTNGWAKILRVNGNRTVTIKGALNKTMANSLEIVTQYSKEMLPELKKRYPSITTSIEGEAKRSAETGFSMVSAVLIGIIGMYLLLCFQFRSYLEPLVVMSTIPLALIGVIFGHMIMNASLSMPGIMGFISLCGIVVNGSLLIVEFVKLRAGTMILIEAAKQASLDRFRPIILTSLTTIFGVAPLLFETSFQAEMVKPIVISIAFGLAFSTLLVLFIVPCFYIILADFGFTTIRMEGKTDGEE